MHPIGLLAAVVCLAAIDAPSIRLTRPGDPKSAFEVVGLPDDAPADCLTVSTVDGPAEQPMLGTAARDGGVIRFRPRFPMEPGVRYRATVRLDGHEPLVADFSIPRKARTTAPTRVVTVSPRTKDIPENLLKFYIEFSAPMARGEAYERIHLLDAAGKPIDAPFLELGEELWDRQGVRFTLLFDPGRIKSGLRPREEVGPVLVAGRVYSLVIDREWPDAEGDTLAWPYRKAFRVGPADHTPPDPKTWSVHPPDAGTPRPLMIDFPEPLDRALLARLIRVVRPSGASVAGTVEVVSGERRWVFRPDEPWAAGDYRIAVDKDLEDLAGNSVGRRFEVDTFEDPKDAAGPRTVELPLTIGPAPARGQ